MGCQLLGIPHGPIVRRLYPQNTWTPTGKCTPPQGSDEFLVLYKPLHRWQDSLFKARDRSLMSWNVLRSSRSAGKSMDGGLLPFSDFCSYVRQRVQPKHNANFDKKPARGSSLRCTHKL